MSSVYLLLVVLDLCECIRATLNGHLSKAEIVPMISRPIHKRTFFLVFASISKGNTINQNMAFSKNISAELKLYVCLSNDVVVMTLRKTPTN